MSKNCKTCIMLMHDCNISFYSPELIPTCPCADCLTKMVCTYDDICDRYTKRMDELADHPKYGPLFEAYETRRNKDAGY